MSKKQNILIFFGVVLLVGIYSSMFTVHMTQSAVILELQKPKEIITKPGLYFKIPFVQQVRYFSKQLLDHDADPAEVITRDKKNLLIDNFTVWRIVDPLTFLQTVRTEQGARSRLEDILFSEIRVETGTHDLVDIVKETREIVMDKVTQEATKKAKEYGIQVVDVRIKRTDLPSEIANSIFNRMRTERTRIAREYRSEGKEEATKIRAETDKEKTILIADAYKMEQEIRGQGDAKAIKIYADAYTQEPRFYEFIRSMEAYKISLKKDTTLLISEEDSVFLKHLNNPE